MDAAPWGAFMRGVEFADPGSSKRCPLRGDRIAPPLRGVPLVTAPRRVKPVSSSKLAGFVDEASRSCAHGLLLGSTRSRAARLSLLRSRMPRALISRLGVRDSVPPDRDVVTVGPDDIDRLSVSDGGALRSCGRTASGLVSIWRVRAAGDLVLSLDCSSCQPWGVGGIGPKAVCPGRLVGGADGLESSRLELGSGVEL
jgi:hypothetical protein